MKMQQATDVRKEWSAVCDSVIREKPAFIKRTRDCMCLSNLSLMMNILSVYQFTANEFVEDDGSITLSLNELDLVENGKTELESRSRLAESILDYANEYYDNFDVYSRAPNRKNHVPYVMKALIINDTKEIGDIIICQAGKS